MNESHTKGEVSQIDTTHALLFLFSFLLVLVLHPLSFVIAPSLFMPRFHMDYMNTHAPPASNKRNSKSSRLDSRLLLLDVDSTLFPDQRVELLMPLTIEFHGSGNRLVMKSAI